MSHRIATLLPILALISSPVMAADQSLICENPGGAYNLVLADGAKAAVINPDSDDFKQPILATIDGMLVLDLGQPGMVSVLHTEAPLRNEIFADGDLAQTDPCRPA